MSKRTLAQLMENGGRLLITQILKEMPYDEYLQTEHWETVRRAALKRAGYRCAVCLRSTTLEVHHITYVNRGEELPEDVIALCKLHHNAVHDSLRAVMHSQFEAQFGGLR